MKKYKIEYRPANHTWCIQKRVLFFFWKDHKFFTNYNRAIREFDRLTKYA